MMAQQNMRALLALLLLAGAARAAIKAPEEGVEREVGLMDLIPYKDEKYGHKYYYQVPESPRGVVLMVHGCVSSGYNYWPQSPECEECRGLPEQLAHTLQALRRGYAVIAVSSEDRKTGCWGWETDSYDVTAILNSWRKDWGLDGLPLYGAGISSGASFLLKLPRQIKFDGIHAEALGIDYNAWGLNEVKGGYPPTLFADMVRDEKTSKKIEANRKTLKSMGVPVHVVDVTERKVYPTYFSERFPSEVSEELSRKIAQGLFDIQMIDKDGTVMEDPRYTSRPWMTELQDVVPELNTGKVQFPEKPGDVLVRGVNSLMNLAYASHEIISDYLTASLLWFESEGKADVVKLLEGYTYGWPPTVEFSYTPTGTEVVEQRPAKLVTRPGTLPGCALEHLTQPGDYCFVISDMFGISVDQLKFINPTLNCDTLQPGDLLCLQPGSPQFAALETSEEVPAALASAAEAAAELAAPALAPVPAPVPAPQPPSPAPKLPPAPAAMPIVPRASTAGEGGPETTTTTSSSSGGVSMGVIVGAAVGGVLAAAAVVGGAWWGVKRRRSRAAYAAAPSAAPAQQRLPSIIPGVHQRFDAGDLTEVVEQTGSPSLSPRRRRAASFNGDSPADSPQLSPTKRVTRSSRGHAL